MSHETLLRKHAAGNEWKVVIDRRGNLLGVIGIPCFVGPDVAGVCDVWVGIETQSDALFLGHSWQQKAIHTGVVRGLSDGFLYDRLGNKLERGVIGHDDATSCTLSIKLKDRRDFSTRRDYDDAWEALKTYVKRVYSLFLGDQKATHPIDTRPYTFEVLGDQSPGAIEWRQMLSDDRVAIIGLGGVGAWIADFVVKSDAAEVHGWDDDHIEPKNILRMPGPNDPNRWIGQPKATWFQDTYSLIHKNVHGHKMEVSEQNLPSIVKGMTFAFVAVDDRQNDRMSICEALANAGLPFVVAGVSLRRQNKQVRVSMRIVTAHLGTQSWQGAIPQVGQSGQEDYGSLDLPDVYSLAASWAIQAWRKVRGQIRQSTREECLVYNATKQSLKIRGVR